MFVVIKRRSVNGNKRSRGQQAEKKKNTIRKWTDPPDENTEDRQGEEGRIGWSPRTARTTVRHTVRSVRPTCTFPQPHQHLHSSQKRAVSPFIVLRLEKNELVSNLLEIHYRWMTTRIVTKNTDIMSLKPYRVDKRIDVLQQWVVYIRLDAAAAAAWNQTKTHTHYFQRKIYIILGHLQNIRKSVMRRTLLLFVLSDGKIIVCLFVWTNDDNKWRKKWCDHNDYWHLQKFNLKTFYQNTTLIYPDVVVVGLYVCDCCLIRLGWMQVK